MNTFSKHILVFSLIVITATGCTKQKPANSSKATSADIFSNRPIGTVDGLFVFTFESPALLAVGTKTDHGIEIPQDAKDKVLAEQVAFEANLKAIAPSAQIIFHYRLALNGMAIYASSEVAEMLSQLPMVKQVARVRQMARPREIQLNPGQPVESVNSVNYIGADAAHKLGFTGRGMRIGIIDTGVDYTHTMLGGTGQGFADNDPSQPNSAFPNAKVIGGIDLVGTTFNAASNALQSQLPKPDGNPLDEQGHGSHVAGTVAGIGDGIHTYSGVAPDATLYAIKVFGKEGSTMDAVVIAAFEFAVDPDRDLNPSDRLDVVNLSLGGGYGQPQILYTEAVRNVTAAGTVVVASAGNAGPVDYIVGAPSTADNALSVAASVDGADINWKFPTSSFKFVNKPDQIARIYEGDISLPVAQADGISGELVDIGLANVDLSDGVKAKLNGKVALISRGGVSFVEKLTRAVDAGAIGAVVYTNNSDDPILMGGEGHFDIPAIMITQAMGLALVEEIKTSPVTVQFKTGHFIEMPENIDKITDFSSKGPRSEDSLFKPEIAAPGQNITSAEMGGGNTGVNLNGTSMAAPHITGAIALIRQAHPELSAEEVKALAMNTTRTLGLDSAEIPMTLQGAGLIQIVPAIEAQIISDTAAISLGRVQVGDQKSEVRTIKLRNLSNRGITLTLDSQTPTPGISFDLPRQVLLPASAEASVDVKINYQLFSPQDFASELNGRVIFKQGGRPVLIVPAMAIRTEASQVLATVGTAGNFTLTNTSPVAGLASAFNLLGVDAKKAAPPANEAWMNRSCDLRSVGYRIIRDQTPQGPQDRIQFAFNLYTPLTTWHMCSLSVLIDTDADGIADQELAGVTGGSLEGLDQDFLTVLLNAPQARDLRLAYEVDLASGNADATVDYTPAILNQSTMAVFNHSGFAVLEAPLALLALGTDGKLHIKVAAQSESGQTFEGDDFLGDALGSWQAVSPTLEEQPYFNFEEATQVPHGGTAFSATKGSGAGELIIYYPFNDLQTLGAEGQEQIVK